MTIPRSPAREAFGAIWVAGFLLIAYQPVAGQDIFVPRELKAVAAAPGSSSQRLPSSDTTEWKEEIARGYIPYHRLTRDDFPINNKVEPKYAMLTSGFIHYQYRYELTASAEHTVARITKWVVRSGFDRTGSSRKSRLRHGQYPLLHEQGHLDIWALHGAQLANVELNDLPVGEGTSVQEAIGDLEIKVRARGSAAFSKCVAEQVSYDAETSHGSNAAKQRSATVAIRKRLKAAGITYAY